MNNSTSPTRAATPPATHDQIAQRAREIWHARGEPAGQDIEIWFEAERQLQAQAKPTKKKAIDPTAVEPTDRGVAKVRRSKSMSKVDKEILPNRGGIKGAGRVPVDRTV